MMLDRFDEEWQEWRCSYCDPDNYDEETDEERYDKPYILLLPMGEEAPDWCPQCNGYMSFTEGASNLKITNTPFERFMKRHEAEE